MNPQCIICCASFVPTDVLYSTYCGHIFHLSCLAQWLLRSQTCPQCRQSTDLSRIHRIWWNDEDGDTSVRENEALKEEINNLKDKAKILVGHVNRYMVENTILAEEIKKLLVGQKKLKDELELRDTSMIHQLDDLNEKITSGNLLHKVHQNEIVKLQEELKNCEAAKLGLVITGNSELKKCKDEMMKFQTKLLQYQDDIKKLQAKLNHSEAEKVAALEELKKHKLKFNESNPEARNGETKRPKKSTKIKEKVTKADENSIVFSPKLKNLRLNARRALALRDLNRPVPELYGENVGKNH